MMTQPASPSLLPPKAAVKKIIKKDTHTRRTAALEQMDSLCSSGAIRFPNCFQNRANALPTLGFRHVRRVR